ncbi:MAG: hypothetical protein A3K19_24650 [Lentisphaerae bacterium RIFOXYB12_FULL_65_16]|nr:MAG: hypothetical protein A3K18_17310 [Lentisphaerae bacterium RIFOXYA12_64_32]OGV84011.1 MAG: hypothetical protein A3K19_24650 [Lentisphaerae bacterium RIFOXYB12_FULL_65_16]
MLTREHILETLRSAKSELETRFRVHRLGLFGSYARGDNRPDSDVDILVDVDPSIGLDFVSLADRIEELLGTSVDVVSTRALKARNRDSIERDVLYV